MPGLFNQNLRERLTRGIDYFNREYFFEAHDEIEELWMDARNAVERNLFHGLVNLATGFYHFRMHNFAGMQSQLKKGVDKLSQLPGRCYGVEVEKLLQRVRLYIRTPAQPAVFPEPLPQIAFHPEEIPEHFS